ncbi:MAG: hypothetical protein OEW32_05490 [Nitrospira sp.]|nr:hypothetical protein [Nitrospira sp.]
MTFLLVRDRVSHDGEAVNWLRRRPRLFLGNLSERSRPIGLRPTPPKPTRPPSKPPPACRCVNTADVVWMDMGSGGDHRSVEGADLLACIGLFGEKIGKIDRPQIRENVKPAVAVQQAWKRSAEESFNAWTCAPSRGF